MSFSNTVHDRHGKAYAYTYDPNAGTFNMIPLGPDYTNPYFAQNIAPSFQMEHQYGMYPRMGGYQIQTQWNNSFTAYPPVGYHHGAASYRSQAAQMPVQRPHAPTQFGAEMGNTPFPSTTRPQSNGNTSMSQNREGMSNFQHNQGVAPTGQGLYQPVAVPDVSNPDFGNNLNGQSENKPRITTALADATKAMDKPLPNSPILDDPFFQLASRSNEFQADPDEDPSIWGAPDESLSTATSESNVNSNTGSQQQEPAAVFDFNQIGQAFEFELDFGQTTQGSDISQASQPQMLPADHDFNLALQIEQRAADPVPPVQQPQAATVPAATNGRMMSSQKGKKRKSSSASAESQSDGTTGKKRRIVTPDSCNECRKQKVRCERHGNTSQCSRCYSKGLPCKISHIDNRTNRSKYDELDQTITAYHGLVQEFLATLYLLSPEMADKEEGKLARSYYDHRYTPSFIVQSSKKPAAEWAEVPHVRELEKYRRGYVKLEEIRKAITQVKATGLRLLGILIHACAVAYHKQMTQVQIKEILDGAKWGHISDIEALQAGQNAGETEALVKQLYQKAFEPLPETVKALPNYPNLYQP
ncbi:hypothetical protein F5Y06DRAFT_297596 [Hypoxylon sp. FL0890]|nr:hypothetical protein F5Y06DRAFT_297596 [Hypoxylon sp. FL0890]